MTRTHLFALLLLLLIPTRVSYAIPPPELIVSVSQSILSVIGILTASLILVFGSIRMYLTHLMSIPLFRYSTYVLGVVIIVLAIVWAVLYQQRQVLTNWQAEVDEEVRAAWARYDSIYIAPEELPARRTLSGAAQEISWTDFVKIADGTDYLLLDIRDRNAFEAGRFTSSMHMNFSDLLRGRWQELTDYKNTPIFITCFFGTTGTIVADFLAAQGFTQLYIPLDGLRETVGRDQGVPFEGSVFPTENYFTIIQRLSLEQILTTGDGAHQVIDLRSPTQYDEPTPTTPTHQHYREFATEPERSAFLQTLSATQQHVLMCNSELSCYHAEMMYLDTINSGINTLGIYDTSQPAGQVF